MQLVIDYALMAAVEQEEAELQAQLAVERASRSTKLLSFPRISETPGPVISLKVAEISALSINGQLYRLSGRKPNRRLNK